jgi:hypothetical protein
LEVVFALLGISKLHDRRDFGSFLATPDRSVPTDIGRCRVLL